MSDEWGPWVDHTTKHQPVPDGTIVQAEMKSVGSGDFVGPLRAEDFDWHYPRDPVVRYRVKKPKGMVVLEAIMADLTKGVPA